MSVIALRRAVTAVVLQVPGVPSCEGPNNVCVFGLVECSQLNCERREADTGASLLECVLRCKWTVNKSCCGDVVHRLNFSLRYGFTVLGFPGIVSGGAAFPITPVLIIL